MSNFEFSGKYPEQRTLTESMRCFESFCSQAMQSADDLKWGHAQRYLDNAREVADTTRWLTSEQKESRLLVRELAIDILRRTGATAEALDVVNEAMVIYADLHQQHSFEICSEKVELLMMLGKFSEAHSTIDSMIERADGAATGELVGSHVLKSRCFKLEQKQKLADIEMVQACAALQRVDTSVLLEIAMHLHRQAVFEREQGDGGRAQAVADVAIEALSNITDSQDVVSMIVTELKLFKADVYDESGEFDIAHGIRLRVLHDLEECSGVHYSGAFKLRDVIADSLLYHGRFDEAESFYRINLAYAHETERTELVQTALASMTNFCMETERFDSFDADVSSFLEAPDKGAEDLYAFSTRVKAMAMKDGESRQNALERIESELKNLSNSYGYDERKARCSLLLMMASIVEHSDVARHQKCLMEAEQLAFDLPDDDAKEFFDRIKGLRLNSEAEEDEMKLEIEKLREALREHGVNFRSARPFSEVTLRFHLGCALLADDQIDGAVEELECSRKWLKQHNATECKLYGQVLFVLAEALERQYQDVTELRSEAEEILRKYGKKER